MNTKKDIVWDVAVIGGGPAGMMAAGRASERGRSVVLLEKNAGLGKKLLITGGGRCNVTNNKPDTRMMLAKYKGSDKFLFSAFFQFGVTEALDFFHGHNMETKEEAEGRVFPASNKSKSVWEVMVRYMKDGGVAVRTHSAVTRIVFDKETKIFRIRLEDKTEIRAQSCVIATGGRSHPETGSTGDGFVWLKRFGHTILENNFALVPVALKDSWVKKLGGVTLKNIKLTVFQDGKKQEVQKGKLLFTHFGISGPTVLNMSKDIGERIQYGDVVLMLDLFPDLDPGGMKEKIQTLFMEESNKKLKNVLAVLIPAGLASAILALLGIDGDIACHSVRREDRMKLIAGVKAVPLHVDGLLGADKAVISSGGVALKEVNFKTMQSRLVPGLYLTGDILNINRPSGGYSLQLCWTTGFIAGNSC